MSDGQHRANESPNSAVNMRRSFEIPLLVGITRGGILRFANVHVSEVSVFVDEHAN